MTVNPLHRTRNGAPELGAFRPADRIVVPVQGTSAEYLAQEWAIQFAAALGVPVVAVHVADPVHDTDGATPEEAFAFVTAAAEKVGVDVVTVVARGQDVAREILDELMPRDLVVIGTRRLAEAFHLGSVAAELVRRAPCPVQIVRIG